ncbi:potassium-transporting ATPase subunit KdpC [Stenotrophomonas maltophilia]|uniref:potassium-transporting ATPase subunit KdpC n=2 Tax=Stenotrophomonas TaxID=40323 RepID=UPI001119EBB7|nr:MULTISPECIES: potassium-transporting ATPase subunit KdpC [Stenotrophomonas]MCF3469248.1 potassium-transporting ATPase subunit KdpC [Stenotrophomonas maltophilia]MCF3493131.1 potassium-transporting ATPase subunit KdpC [Stenotrophomonas maltophilia]MCF3513439.1 potassium-transporting ATPase subunit KdpC [Stenotrophomonas maltophilia]QCZ95848.1 potassium-transporting ATPase subunit C [Stenotrophomonas sp. pho]
MNRSASTSSSLPGDAKAEARVASLQDGACWRPAIGLGLASLLLAGAVYAGIATGFAGLAYPTQAEGSLLRDGSGQVRGSAWLAQPFTGDGYFQARPSAANYDPMAAAGSNMARSNPALAERVAASTAAVAAREGVAPAQVPADLVTQSAGGLDPQLSPAAAQLQVARVARARGLPVERVQALVQAHTEGRQWGLFGQPRVNVVTLNFALDHAAKAP